VRYQQVVPPEDASDDRQRYRPDAPLRSELAAVHGVRAEGAGGGFGGAVGRPAVADDSTVAGSDDQACRRARARAARQPGRRGDDAERPGGLGPDSRRVTPAWGRAARSDGARPRILAGWRRERVNARMVLRTAVAPRFSSRGLWPRLMVAPL